MCDDSDSEINGPLSSSAHPLNVDIVAERILSFLEKHPDDLIKYRLVCHKWNDIIVRKIKKTGISFKIPLRYEPHVPQFIDVSGGRRGAEEVLDTVMATLTGTAARLRFDSLIIDRDFYLAGVMTQFKKFLEIQGQSIHHLKIKIRPEESPIENENHVVDCAQVVSIDNLRALFLATPNLKSLNFCVRFSHYEGKGLLECEQRCIYPFTLPPQLKQLTTIKIKEPEGVQYSVELFQNLMSLPSKLDTFNVKPTKQLSNFARALQDKTRRVKGSLVTLNITHAHVDSTYLSLEKRITEFSYLSCLASLTLNNISGKEKYNCIRSILLYACQDNLKFLVLGEEKLSDGEGEDWNSDDDWDDESLFPPVMRNLRYLEINLTEFNVRDHVKVESYGTQFPRLSTLRITGCLEEVWTLDQLEHLLPGVNGQSQTLEKFYLIGNIDGENERVDIVCTVNATFPMTNLYFSD